MKLPIAENQDIPLARGIDEPNPKVKSKTYLVNRGSRKAIKALSKELTSSLSI